MGQADPTVRDPAERSGLHDLPDGDGRAVVQAGQGDGQRDAGAVAGRDDLLALGDGRGQQLLGEDVFAGRRGPHHDVAVHVGAGGDHHGVDVVAGEERVEIRNEFDPEGVGAGPTAPGVVVPDRDQLGVRAAATVSLA